MICNNCGKDTDELQGFCIYCGANVEIPSRPNFNFGDIDDYAGNGLSNGTGYSSYTKYPKKSSGKGRHLKWIIPVVIVVAVLGVLAGIFIPKLLSDKRHSSPEAVVEAFFKEVKKGNIDNAIDCFHPRIQKELNEDINATKLLFKVFEGINVHVRSTEYADEKMIAHINKEERANFDSVCYVRCKLSMAGTSEIYDMGVGREDGKWYLYEFRVDEEDKVIKDE